MSTQSKGDIVIIDDAALVVRVLRKTLESQGYNVRSADCGQDGVAEVMANAPDVVVSDLHMPDMNGHQVIEKVHAHDRGIPVILLSSDADLSAVLGAVRRGAFDYVLKSDLGNLAAAVERAMAYSRHTSGGPSPDLAAAVANLKEDLAALDNAVRETGSEAAAAAVARVQVAARRVARAGGTSWN